MEAAKRNRSSALSNFTRTVNSVNKLITNEAPLSLVKPRFEKVLECWEILEKAQDSFIQMADEKIDIETDPLGVQYLDTATDNLDDLMARYSSYLKEEE